MPVLRDPPNDERRRRNMPAPDTDTDTDGISRPLRAHYLTVDDEDHRLRIVRTPTESLHEIAREDERRGVGKRKRRHTFRARSFLNRSNTTATTSSKVGRAPSQVGSSSHGHSSFIRPSTSSGGIAAALAKASHGLGNDFVQQVREDQQQKALTTRTANQEEEAKAEQFRAPAEEGLDTGTTDVKAAEGRRRRNVYLNVPIPSHELDKYGEPRIYSRNKVRTSKYTIWTFLPKNLTEQFRRVANLYFLGLVILQIFPIFGGASPVLAMLPLLAILTITGVKDAIEDYRRQQLDDGVNNSAVTRLGDWRNVNVPRYTRSIIARIFGLGGKRNPDANSSSGAPTRQKKVSKGVRKLREKEGEFNADFLYAGGAVAQDSTASFFDQTIHDNRSTDSHARPTDSVNHSHLLETLAREERIAADESYATITGNDSTVMLDAPPALSSLPMSGSNRSRSKSLARSMATSARTMQKQGVVDYDRQAPGTAKWERTLWKKLEVGDVVLLREDDQVPADMVVLSTSDADGQCFVETKNLDGETNLKPRRALKGTMGIQHEEDVEHAEFVVDSEPPHANLYSYNGVLRYQIRQNIPNNDGLPTSSEIIEKKEAITINELLLRGCAIRNTTWIIALVVYTGEDTKIMLNQGATPSKRSKIEKETNFNVIANFVILVAMCAAAAIANGLYLAQTNTSANYYEPGVQISASAVLDAVITFGACLIAFQNIVPISLVITVELVKTIQAIFIYQDIEMYYEPLDHPCVPKTWNISDDLGQIEYIFSDKTGTLTQNIMEFQKCSINGVPYGEGITEAMLGQAKREGRDLSAFDPLRNKALLQQSKSEMVRDMNTLFRNRYLREDKLTFIAPKMINEMANPSSPHTEHIIRFFRALAVCHTVLADRSDADNQDLIEYKAESPDEAALVAAARDCGFVFLHKSNNDIEIEVMGRTERYQPLRILEFNSSRKRMSVLVRQADGRILMICKGADSVIYQRLRKDHDEQLKAATTRDMEAFANAGLRTLCISYKYVAEEEFGRWAAAYDAACAAVDDREDEIEKACELIENNLTILGATALEDKLQVGVPDAIAQLHKAGIKLWILTGDKVQTAIEIGFSCNLLSSDMDIMILSSETEDGARTQIESGLVKIGKARSGVVAGPAAGFAVVIDGETLRFALTAALKPLFLDLTTQCGAVVCCRVSPSQKALTVKLVKDGKKAMTLAIGDGANDVAMIQEAHIGVGIAGLEGAQASMSADYAIGQFRYLNKLLLVHGRWCYLRVAEMHANFFYKNIVWVFAMFWYQWYCNFDVGYIFDYSLVLLYNLAFTSLPVIVMGAFDRDLDAKFSLAYPQLYRRGIQGLEYTRTIFWAYMFDGLYQSAAVFFMPVIMYSYGTTLVGTGYDMSAQVELGTTIASAAVVCVTLFVGLNTYLWTGLVTVVLVGSALSLYIWIAIYSAFPWQFDYLVVILFSSINYWLIILVTQIVALGPRYAYKYIRSNYFPIDNDIIREMAIKGHFRDVPVDVEGGQNEEKHGIPQTPSALDLPIVTKYESRTPSPGQVQLQPRQASLELNDISTIDQREAASRQASSASGHRKYQSAQQELEELNGEVLGSPTSPNSQTSQSHLYPTTMQMPYQLHTPRSSGAYHSPAPSHAQSFRTMTPYSSPSSSPNPQRTDHRKVDSAGSALGMRRDPSVTSFATAADEPYQEFDGENVGWAR